MDWWIDGLMDSINDRVTTGVFAWQGLTFGFVSLVFSVSGKERQFLRDFVSASEETSGGRLARWLQPESVVDTAKSQLLFPSVFSANVATFGTAASNSSPVKANGAGN